MFESDRKLSSVWVAMSGVVGAHLVPGGEHLATTPAWELPGLVDVLKMSLHGPSAPEPLKTLWTGNSVILM